MSRFLSALLLLTLSNSVYAQNEIRIPVTSFNPMDMENDTSTSKWEVLQFQKTKKTEYRLVVENENSHIAATSNNSASGLIYPIHIDPKEFSTIEWTWKVDATNTKSSLSKKKGDDFPVRIFITFEYSSSDLRFKDKLKYFALKTFSKHSVPLRALTYVWTHQEEVNSMSPNPFSNWVYSIAAESGTQHTGSWKMELRNIYDDYIKAFGEEPGNITGVAIMSDTDNTKEMAQGYYGDIVFKRMNN